MTRRRRGAPATGGWPHVIVLDPHAGGLALSRAMIRAGARVTLVTEPAFAWEAHSRGVESALAPFEPDGEPWLAQLRRLAAGGEECVVLPATDRGSALLSRAAERLPANLRAFEAPGSAHLPLMDKDTADAIAQRAGVAVPWTARVRNDEELAAAVADAPWPCVVKPIFSHEWRGRYGEARVFLVADAAEAASRLEQPLRDGVGMLLCQYIPGGDDAVEEAIVVRLADGSYPVRFGCHKLRQYPRGFGVTTLGQSSELTETTALAERVLDEAGFVGVAGVEVKRHAETGERWFIEVNVRIPGQWGLGDACGVEASTRLVAALAGRESGPPPPLRPGVRIVAPDVDVQFLRELLREAPARRRPLVLARFLAPYLGARELGLLDPRDLGPGIGWARVIAARRAGRLGAFLKRSRPSG